jgi:hypothetical protein
MAAMPVCHDNWWSLQGMFVIHSCCGVSAGALLVEVYRRRRRRGRRRGRRAGYQLAT